MTINYRELLADAESQIDTYKSPNIDEFKEKFSELLEAAGVGSLMRDHVDGISTRSWNGVQYLHIDTSWSARGCRCDGSYELPLSILDAPDPLKAAKIWGIEKKLDEAKAEVSKYRSYVETYEKKVAEFQTQLEIAQ